jgi:ankyrin repeat protein
VPCLVFFLSLNMDANITNNNNSTPLHCACFLGQERFVDFLTSYAVSIGTLYFSLFILRLCG